MQTPGLSSRTTKSLALIRAGLFMEYPGDDLLSHAVTHAVPSALEGLTSVFGMGTGVSPPPLSPGNLIRSAPNRSPAHQVYQSNRGSRTLTRFVGYQAARPISTGKLHALPHFHTRPINLVIYEGSLGA